ncbi:hypothetical protein RYX36_029031, partial [Vicia faba]
SSGSPPSETFSSSSSGSSGDRRVSFRWGRSTPRGEEEKAYAVEQQIREAIENEDQKRIEDLNKEACRLKNENDRLKKNIKAAEDAYAEMEETNNVVRVQTMEL